MKNLPRGDESLHVRHVKASHPPQLDHQQVARLDEVVYGPLTAAQHFGYSPNGEQPSRLVPIAHHGPALSGDEGSSLGPTSAAGASVIAQRP